jgi:formamidopyrimidine-DNA glycosylase
MPELPEVETMVRDLIPRIVGRRIVGVDAAFAGCVIYPEYPEFEQRVAGQSITGISRRGKYAIFSLESGDALVIHRGMTGSLFHRAATEPLEPYVRLLFRLDDGTELRFNDPRKFGKVYVMEATGAERPLPWKSMGPEPLNGAFDLEGFREKLRSRTALIKPLLLNQQVVAGLGNIYVDLFLAGVHPERRANSLTPEEVDRLHAAIRTVLAAAVQRRGTTFSSYKDIEGRSGQYQDSLRVFRQAGAACPRCGAPIERTVVGGRGTYICCDCQRR